MFSPYFLVNKLRRCNMSFWARVNLLRLLLRTLRKTCELLCIITLRSAFFFLQIHSTAACVYCGVPTSLLDISFWGSVNLLRLVLRILRKPCELLGILSLCSCFILFEIDSVVVAEFPLYFWIKIGLSLHS